MIIGIMWICGETRILNLKKSQPNTVRVLLFQRLKWQPILPKAAISKDKMVVRLVVFD